MTDKTFTFTIEQIKQIYQAGIRRGSDEASAYEWGCRASGNEYDELVSAVDDILNDAKQWGDPDRTDWDTIKSWFKETA